MHGEKLIERFGTYQLGVGGGELEPHYERFDSGDKEENQGTYAVENTYSLVIDSSYPTPNAGVCGGLGSYLGRSRHL
jgi:hypothetical protein